MSAKPYSAFDTASYLWGLGVGAVLGAALVATFGGPIAFHSKGQDYRIKALEYRIERLEAAR